ncbi:MAG: putative membrane-anchored protein [Maribacter sp.]|jgi:uncharacterized membrane-anchored protein
MKTKLELLGRTLLIFCTTILAGTFFSAMYMDAINYTGNNSFTLYYFTGIIVTAIYSIPTLFILFIGSYLIYKRCKSSRQKWQYITLLWLLNCYGPVIFFINCLTSNIPDDVQLTFASIPYVFTSFISIFSFTYYFDKKKLPIFQQGKEVMDDDILDAPFE